MDFAVVHGHRMTNHAGEDGRRPCPGPDHTALIRAIERFDLFLQLGVDKWPLLGRSRHDVPPRLLSLRRAAPHNHRVSPLVVAGAGLNWLAPFCFRLAADRGLPLAAAVWMVARVHRRAPDSWPPPTVPVPTRLPNHDVFVIDVSDLTERRHAVEMDQSHLSRRHS